MESQEALIRSLSCFKNNDVFESFSRSTRLDLRAQRTAAHKTRKKHTPHPVTENEGPRILYLTWFINEEEQDNEEFLEKVPDKFKVVKQRVESHVKRYYPVCQMAADYWQMEVDTEVDAKPLITPPNCSIYTTEGVYIRVVFSFRSM
jgi:hypothetical protein